MKVSVIIPNYCHARFLNRRIDSVLNQTYDDFEVIILDDCSTDNSRDIIETYRHHPRVSHIVYNEKNSGSTFVQWDKGFELAQGQYIWIAESDDEAAPTFLEECVTQLEKHPSAKAILVNNPTYYGICSDLGEIVRLGHAAGMKVLADEAHGTHFYFGENMPVSAMAAGADLASVSMHKSGGSLTQSSFLLCGPGVNADYVRQIINLTQTTSGSYLLMVSLDISRKNLALHGKHIFRKVTDLTEYAREEINSIGDYYAYGSELIDGDAVYDFDVTKLAVNTLDVGLAGIEVYDVLRDFYDIQTEFGDLGNLLAYVSVGDRERDIERLVAALADIRRRYKRDKATLMRQEYIAPQVVAAPQEAFYADKQSLPLDESVGRICAEFVMCYPPGIPILAPGERITREILDYIRYAKDKNCMLLGTEDPDVNNLQVIKGVISPCD